MMTCEKKLEVCGNNVTLCQLKQRSSLAVHQATSLSFPASLAPDSGISTQTVVSCIDVFEYDVGLIIRSTTPFSDESKHRLLTNPYRPAASYNFSGIDLAKNVVFSMQGLNSFLHGLPIHVILRAQSV